MSIATTILNQLGGPGFVMMTGAKNFVSDGNTLRMALPRNASGANRLYITLTPMDDYTMRFFKHTNGRITRTGRWIDDKNTDVEVVNGVFCDTLQENFTRAGEMCLLFAALAHRFRDSPDLFYSAHLIRLINK